MFPGSRFVLKKRPASKSPLQMFPVSVHQLEVNLGVDRCGRDDDYADGNDDYAHGPVDSANGSVDYPGADDSVTDPVDVIKFLPLASSPLRSFCISFLAMIVRLVRGGYAAPC